jgi:hypothetical protein
MYRLNFLFQEKKCEYVSQLSISFVTRPVGWLMEINQKFIRKLCKPMVEELRQEASDKPC